MNSLTDRTLAMLLAGLLTILVLACYFHTQDAPFVLDDHNNITRNPSIRLNELNSDSLSRFLTGIHPSQNRWVANASFALNYYFDGYRTRGYHAVNIILHLLTTFLVFILYRQYLARMALGPRDVLLLAFLAAAIWSLNPIQTSTVTYIVQRMTVLATLFLIGSFLAYLKARRMIHQGSGYAGTAGYVLLAVMLWVLALLSKEMAAIMPVLILLHELFFTKDLFKSGIRRVLLTCFLSSAAFLGLTLYYLGANLTAVFEGLDRVYEMRDFTLAERLLTEPRVVFTYMSLFLFPLSSRLTLYYDYPLSISLLEPFTTVWSIAGLLAIPVAAFVLPPRYRLTGFGLLWALSCLVIESSFLPLEIIYEHRFYLPSVGFVLALVACLVLWFSGTAARLKYLYIILSAFLAFSAINTYMRNNVWRDDLAFNKAAVSKTPDNVKANIYLASSYFKRSDFGQGMTYLDHAYQLEPQSIEVLATLFVVHTEALRSDRGTGYLEKIKASISAGNFQCNQQGLLDHVARILFSRKMFADVIWILEVLDQCGRKPAVFYENLAACYVAVGKTGSAIVNFQKALDRDPDSQMYIYRLARLYVETGDLDNARIMLDRLRLERLAEQYRAEVQELMKIVHRARDSQSNSGQGSP